VVSPAQVQRRQSKEIKLTPREEELWKEAYNNPDYRMYTAIFNLLERRGKLATRFFRLLINPYESEDVEKLEEDLAKVNIPFISDRAGMLIPTRATFLALLDIGQMQKCTFQKNDVYWTGSFAPTLDRLSR